ncbi:hypothetical protein HanXRQr2_Chr11g0489241 [Helianthus annuus]|uniref:Uncharacterized protein n=1 Tax=Helianthus annuus TaxID=4232 RepID=A0A9K3HNM7_HELAN|nr:hypothetical protein HanXRQr2_Chr11g0489241 [Helianthus annuus]KAJ0501445.1 hypothetical protein HanHA300_Chr11g0400871 [Helianthus annuus]KAJ0517355.1 hypothetical protein HanHA89_Chr11g0424411 [Helianthus annuus]KAJ0685365.1 hypothetical protein HanLR1_Chr11g0401851 [Helianthus annuus]KAJ0689262.1 hypothetical protein HanOQP8_Chr11g0403731 [Helianthus annuus]
MLLLLKEKQDARMLMILASSYFILSVGCFVNCFPCLHNLKDDWRHMGVLVFVCVLGINTSTGDIRQAWFGRMSFCWYPHLHPTPKPKPIGFRNCVCQIKMWFLCTVMGMVALGWVTNHRWNTRKRDSFMSWCVWMYCILEVMLLDIGLFFVAVLRSSKSWPHHLQKLCNHKDYYTPLHSSNSLRKLSRLIKLLLVFN